MRIAYRARSADVSSERARLRALYVITSNCSAKRPAAAPRETGESRRSWPLVGSGRSETAIRNCRRIAPYVAASIDSASSCAASLDHLKMRRSEHSQEWLPLNCQRVTSKAVSIAPANSADCRAVRPAARESPGSLREPQTSRHRNRETPPRRASKRLLSRLMAGRQPRASDRAPR